MLFLLLKVLPLSHRYFHSLFCLLGHFLSYSFLGHICSLMKHTAVSHLMAKLRKPGLLISSSSLDFILALRWNWEWSSQNPEGSGSKLTSMLKKPAHVVSICLVVEFLQEGLSGQGCTGLPGKHEDVSGMIWPIGCYHFTLISLMSYYLVSPCCFSCLL